MSHSQSVSSQANTVELVIPCRPEFVGIARLAVLGIASRMPFSYDEVEDVRLAVGEACTHAVERAGESSSVIRITSVIDPSALSITVSDDVAADAASGPKSEEALMLEEAGVDQQGLGALLMEILVDDVKIETTPNGTTVYLTKLAPE